MRLIFATIFLALFATIAFAEDPARRAQISAATASAVSAMQEEIGRQPLGQKHTVKDLLDSTGGGDDLKKTLQRSRQLGGPRWIDEQTCQVRLEISGQRIANALIQIAAVNAKSSPVPAEDVGVYLRDWDQKTFSATGSSTGAAMIEHARPPRNEGAWAGVADDARKQTVGAAKRDAIDKYLNSVRPVELAGGKTIGDALSDENVLKAVNQWASGRPVTRIDFRDDLHVQVSLGIEPTEFTDDLRVALASAKSPIKIAEVDWEKVSTEVSQKAAPANGDASVQPVAAGMAPSSSILPTQPPVWVSQWIEVQGQGVSPDKSKLRAARNAEADALLKLRAKVDELALSPQMTIGQAAKTEPRIESAVRRTVNRARIVKSDYRDDGSVLVNMNLELQDLWDKLQTVSASQ